jgi:pimeloyl-ACP methyl ester carboxylesterase
MDETHVVVNGAKIKLLHGGHGPPLLYLHSSAGETFWLPFHDALAQRFEVFAPANPGCDTSEGLEHIDSIEDLAFHTVDLMDAIGVPRAHVVGLSLGGWLAAEIGVRWPERLDKLVLVDSAGLHVPEAPMAALFELMGDAERMRRLIFADPDSPLARMLVTPLEETPEPLLLLRLKAAEAAARVAWNPYFHNPKLPGRLRRIRAPTLVIWGEEDRLIPLAHGRAYAAGIPGARLEVIAGCGHMPIVEAVPALVERIVAFLT